ncbi:MAG: [protein-PII] uridylyltransferase [Desulfobacterales bacterium]
MPEKEIKHACQKAAGELRRKKENLVSDFLRQRPREFMERNAQILDDYFRESFEKSMVGPGMEIIRNPYAIIALGGYGRQEQCLHSDVDILFLFKKEVPEKAEALIREIIYPLWDIGLDIGHATRSLKDCLRLAAKDFEVLTSLLDARFICGMSPLHSELRTQVRDKIIFRKSAKIVEWMLAANRRRHEYFGNSAYLLEPNLKEGPGGLRDYHTMLWLSRIRFHLETPRDMEYQGWLSHEEFASLMNSLEFIWNVRSGLHLLTGRKYDQLHFENQVRIAQMLGYREESSRQGVEVFLGELQGHMEQVKQNHLLFLCESGKTKKWFRLEIGRQKQSTVEGLEIRKNTLSFVSPEHILRNPLLLLKIFEESAVLQIPLDTEARRLIREFAHLADRKFRSSADAVELFERILVFRSPEAFHVLSEMHSTGVLTCLIPEMDSVTNRIEYDTWHIHPVDRHLLETVRIIKDFGTSEDKSRDSLCAQICHELPRKNLLLWAALLHDIGKGIPEKEHCSAGAEIALGVMREMGYKEEDALTVAFLVREHLFLFHTATRRDMDDKETIAHCAHRIRNAEHLRMLFLLTVADRIATGPGAWNEWTSVLLRNLFIKTLARIENADDRTKNTHWMKEKTQQILARIPAQEKKECENLLHLMSERYLLQTSEADVREHMRMFRSMGAQEFVWKISRAQTSCTRTVTICGKDRPGYFSKIAGVFAINRINILEARTHTWRNHSALSVFEVMRPPDLIFEEERWARAQRELRSALSGKLNIMTAIAERIAGETKQTALLWKVPARVEVDNEISSACTVIEVFALDAPGLLFRLSDALFRCRLNIQSARISTVAEQAVDVFYVTDFDGRKVEDPNQVAVIRTRLAEQLPESGVAEEREKVAV